MFDMIKKIFFITYFSFSLKIFEKRICEFFFYQFKSKKKKKNKTFYDLSKEIRLRNRRILLSKGLLR